MLEHVACMGQLEMPRILHRKFEKRSLKRTICSWNDNIKMDFRYTAYACVERMCVVVQDRVHCEDH